jgi:hypothetical protein
MLKSMHNGSNVFLKLLLDGLRKHFSPFFSNKTFKYNAQNEAVSWRFGSKSNQILKE